MILKNSFGNEWWELLSPFLLSEEWTHLVKSINKDRITNTVIPEKGSDLTTKIFRDLAPDEIKVVLIGQDPYHSNTDIYDGYAFSCSKLPEPQPSLKNIIKEIERTFNENFNLDRTDLTYLVKQGVFLINSSLSVRRGQPSSHLGIWESFTRFWITALSKYNPKIVWILAGNSAQKYSQYISGNVINVGHPSPLNTTHPFIGSNVFIEANTNLKNKIEW